jgi:hypothetical protein
MNSLVNKSPILLIYLDREFLKIYQEFDDKIIEDGRRTQQFEFSGRNLLRVFVYLDHFRVRNPETERIDIIQTLINAIELYYIESMASEEGRENARTFAGIIRAQKY